MISGALAVVFWPLCTTTAMAQSPPPSFRKVWLPNQLRNFSLVSIRDVDADGHSDLLISGGKRLWVFPGNGTLEFPNWYQLPDIDLGGVAALDFNNDGYFDVLADGVRYFNELTLSGPTTELVRVFFGQPDGHFLRGFDFAGPRSAVRHGDFNGDGTPDLLLGRSEWYLDPGRGGTFRGVFETYFSDGRGAFTGPVRTIFQDPNDTGVARYVGDLNGDGRDDLLLSSDSVVLADGQGGFQSPIPLTIPPRPRDIMADDWLTSGEAGAGDFNNDGKRDLMVRFRYSAKSVDEPKWGEPREFCAMYLGDGSGQFAAPVQLVEPPDHWRHSINQVIADANGDGNDDVVLTGVNTFFPVENPLYGTPTPTDVYLGTGTGTFSGPILSRDTGGSSVNGQINSRLADVDGDGRADLITANGGGLRIAPGDGTGHFAPATTLGAYDHGWSAGAAAGDFNGDGNIDVAVANASSYNVSLWFGDGNEGWTGPTNYKLGEHYEPIGIIAADLNADGALDLAVACKPNQPTVPYPPVFILYGDGAGHFTVNRDLKPGLVTGLVAGDFDRDGTIDLAFSTGYVPGVDIYFDMPGARRRLTVYDPTFNFNNLLAAEAGIAATNLDDNPLPDFVRSNRNGILNIFLNAADPAAREIRQLWMGNVEAYNVAAGDVDGDGFSDLAVPAYNQARRLAAVVLARGAGRANFHTPVEYDLPIQCLPANVGIVDLDGHGQRAVVVECQGLWVFVANTDGTLRDPISFEAGYSSRLRMIPLIDVNHDGLIDAVRSQDILLNLGACGNGRIDGAEECDDGNSTSCDGCSATCHREAGALCGDGIVNTQCGEQCDDGAANSDVTVDACRTNCRLPRCGDGARDSNEQCDDGNIISCDGCSAACALDPAPVCGDHLINASCGEQCDEGSANRDAPDVCRTDCKLPRCGDGITDANEECDDRNDDECDGCTSQCTLAPLVCGDGFVNAACGEQCDDGNRVSDDGCSAACQLELIAGGGSVTTDCLTEWMVVNPHNTPLYDRKGRLSPRQICHDNDPACDFDGGVVGSCTFHVGVCVNISDPALPRCTPAPLQGYDVTKPSVRDVGRSRVAADIRARVSATTQTMTSAKAGTCSAPIDVTVPLGARAGILRATRQMLRTRALTVSGKRDDDTLTFICAP